MTYFQANLAISLFAAHILSDFVFQTDNLARSKAQLRILLLHCLIVALLSYLLVGLWTLWLVVLATFASHLVIDFVKLKWFAHGVRAFSGDQLAHILVIGGLVYLIPLVTNSPVEGFWQELVRGRFYQTLLVVSGFFVATHAGGVLVGLSVQPFLRRQIREQIAPERASCDFNSPTRKGFEQGGKLIGQLERAMIFVFVMAGQPAAIGFLIAAKSILRFGDIGTGVSRKEIEYIIIGTFLSFLLAVLIAYLTRIGQSAYIHLREPLLAAAPY